MSRLVMLPNALHVTEFRSLWPQLECTCQHTCWRRQGGVRLRSKVLEADYPAAVRELVQERCRLHRNIAATAHPAMRPARGLSGNRGSRAGRSVCKGREGARLAGDPNVALANFKPLMRADLEEIGS